jgi:hypothetical protein
VEISDPVIFCLVGVTLFFITILFIGEHLANRKFGSLSDLSLKGKLSRAAKGPRTGPP